tara:strand:+ start:26797 stop:26976 length:180 start_codon:yes stop_codon:yes gene_type:complete
MKDLKALKKEDVQLSKEFHDLILQVKDNDLFLELLKVVGKISNNAYQRACEDAKAIYKN